MKPAGNQRSIIQGNATIKSYSAQQTGGLYDEREIPIRIFLDFFFFLFNSIRFNFSFLFPLYFYSTAIIFCYDYLLINEAPLNRILIKSFIREKISLQWIFFYPIKPYFICRRNKTQCFVFLIEQKKSLSSRDCIKQLQLSEKVQEILNEGNGNGSKKSLQRTYERFTSAGGHFFFFASLLAPVQVLLCLFVDGFVSEFYCRNRSVPAISIPHSLKEKARAVIKTKLALRNAYLITQISFRGCLLCGIIYGKMIIIHIKVYISLIEVKT